MDNSRGCKKKKSFWESMFSKYQQKNTQLQQQQCELQHHLEAMECALPAVIQMCQDRGDNKMDLAKFMSRVGKADTNDGSCFCMTPKSTTQIPQKQSNINSMSSNLENSCLCNPNFDTKSSNATTIISDECPCMSDGSSMPSLTSVDAEYMTRLQELVERERLMKLQIQEMQHREEVYMATLQQADEVWANIENCYKQCLCTAKENEEHLRLKHEKLKEENGRLNDELKDAQLELKQCLERIDGPISRELKKEKCLCKQLENDLLTANRALTDKDNSFLSDMSRLNGQLNNALANVCQVTATNKELKDELSMLKAKYKVLQKELIAQKISEGQALQKMQNMLEKQETFNVTAAVAIEVENPVLKSACIECNIDATGKVEIGKDSCVCVEDEKPCS